MENAVEQRSLGELRALYQFEPSLRDIFVEGPGDRQLLSWSLRDQDRIRTHIYAIDEIAIPDEILRAYNLRSGARSKVIALAKEMDEALPDGSSQVTCIVDQNCEGALGISHGCGRLLLTDYADLDGYLLTADTVGKFLALVLRVEGVDQRRLLEMYFAILHEPFLLRMAGTSMGISIARVDVTKSCSLDGDEITLNREDLTKRMLGKSGAIPMRADLEKRVDELRSRLGGDARRYVNGHEFMELFAWHWAPEMRRSGLRDFSVLPRLFLNGSDLAPMNSEALFLALQGRLNS
jgi:hypothetical protein